MVCQCDRGSEVCERGDEEDMWAEDGEFVLIVLKWCVSVR